VHGRKALEIGMEEQTARVERMLNRYDMQKPLAARSCVGSRRRAVEYASGGSRSVSFCGLYVGYIGSQAPPVLLWGRPGAAHARLCRSVKGKAVPQLPLAALAATATKPAIKATAVMSDSDDSC
jgi:hypothetical protein